MVKAAKRRAENGQDLPPVSSKRNKTREAGFQVGIPFESNDSDSEEDCGRLQSQEFLLQTKKALKQKASKQTNAHADQFKKIVQEKQHALLELLDNRAIVALEQRTKGHEALTSVLSRNLMYHVSMSTDTDLSTMPILPSGLSQHPLQKTANTLSRLSQELLKSYDKIAQEISACEGVLEVGRDWEGDFNKLQHLLQVGKLSTQYRVTDMLVDQKERLPEQNRKDEGEMRDREVWSELAGVEIEEDAKETWASVAHKMKKGVRQLVKHLPDE